MLRYIAMIIWKHVQKWKNFHERTGHKLPSDQSKLQGFLNDLLVYTKEHEMRINETKTNVILFNRAKKDDFLPKLTVGQSTVLNVVKEAKILGVKIQNDLKWNSNTTSICRLMLDFGSSDD